MRQEMLGLYLSVASTLCASSMGICAKLAGAHGVPVFEIVLARSLVLMSLTLPQLVRKRINPLRCQRRGMLLLRGLLGFGAVSTFYWAVQYLPLADAAVLMFLTPVIVAALSPLLLRELPSRGVCLALPAALAGVALVSQPSFLFGGGQGLSAAGVALGVLQATFSACAKLCIRALGATEPVQTIVAGMAAVSIVGAAGMCAVLPRHFVLPADARTWLLLLATGLLGFGNQMLSTTSLKLCSAAASVAMSYVGVLWSMLADLALFGDAPNACALAGAALVGASSYLVVHSQQQVQQQQQQLEQGGSCGGGSYAGAKQCAIWGGRDGVDLGEAGQRGEVAEVTEMVEAGRGWGELRRASSSYSHSSSAARERRASREGGLGELPPG